MVGKGESVSTGVAALDYVIKKKESEIIDKNLIIGDKANAIGKEFKIFQNLNHRCSNNTLSFVLSPERPDGKRLNSQELKVISQDFLKKMKLENHQSICVKHHDTKTPHLHIIVNRIDENGNAYKDKHIGYKSQRIADEIAQAHNLTRAKIVEQLNKENLKEIKKEILRRSEIALSHKAKDLKDYIELMKANKIAVIPTINKQGNMQGLRLEFQGHNFKASEIHRSKLSLKFLSAEMEKSSVQKVEITQEKTRYKGHSR
jgi:hypothetical protein